MRKPLVIALLVVAAAAGAAVATWLAREVEPAAPDSAAVVERMREVARLQTLQLTLYKKISFEPDPVAAESFWGEVASWVKHTVRNPQGRAIVFAEVELGMDLDRLSPRSVRISGRKVEVVLPRTEAQVRLLPAETEVIGSNLNSAETAMLFEKAKAAFEREVMADPRLMERARASNERAVRALLITLGFREVVFVERLPGGGAG